ncbi:OxaA precursor [Streptococcus mitis]|uniref:OxaA n=1 Tax=Streptococcus mitis TaxID=28037 RepID=A0A2I1YYG3_STRMT|nr:OxaA precursor [Streptococcus mitis]
MLVDKTFLHKLLLKKLIKSIIHLFPRKEKRNFKKKSVSFKTLIS